MVKVATNGATFRNQQRVVVMIWSDDKIELLKTLWIQGKPASEIADILGDQVSRNAIIGKAHRLGLAGRPSPIKKREQKLATLQVITERMCKWPFGDPKKPDFHFGSHSVSYWDMV